MAAFYKPGSGESTMYLRPWSSSIEQSGRSMSEPPLGHCVVCLQDRLNVLFVDPNRDSHQHVLWPLNHLVIHLKKVRSLQSFETEVIVIKVPVVDNLTVQTCRILQLQSQNPISTKITNYTNLPE